MLSRVEVTVQSPAPRDKWASIYAADPHSMPSQAPEWAAAVAATGLFKDETRLYTFGDGREAILPLFRSKGPRPLTRLSSPPTGWGYGGAISAKPLSSYHLASIVEDLEASCPLQVHLRPNPLDSTAWREAIGPRWIQIARIGHVLDLEGGFDKVWKERFRPRTRTTINKAERANLDVDAGNAPQLVDEFYGLLEKSFERWAEHDHRPVAIARWRGRRRDPIDPIPPDGKPVARHVQGLGGPA